MNVVMTALSLQLLLYSLAWLLLGIAYRLKRAVALQWAAGWFLGACATILVFLNTLDFPLNRAMVMNVLVVSAFLLLRQGLDDFTGFKRWRWDFVLVLSGLLLVEMLRSQDAAYIQVQVLAFTLTVCWPLLGMVWRMVSWMRATLHAAHWQVALNVSPIVVTIALFVVRAVMVLTGTDASTVNFGSGSNFDLISALLFLTVLGAFNFSIAGLVLGGLIERLRILTVTDQLTGLANRRVMTRRLEEEHARFLRCGHAYSVVMMDLDHFKKVNDTFGHRVGDQVLKGLADLLQSHRRQTDTLARIGGEEFMLLMPMTDLGGAVAYARRQCERVANAALATDAGTQHVTISLGVAEVRQGDTTCEPVANRADAALYRAKEDGRNRVESAARAVVPG